MDVSCLSEMNSALAANDMMLPLSLTAHGIGLPMAAMFFASVVLLYMFLMIFFFSTDHSVLSWLKLNAPIKRTSRLLPVAPFGMIETIGFMMGDQQPWFPLKARKAMNGADTFILPLPRRPVMTGDSTLAREILTDPLSVKSKMYQTFEPLGIGTTFTRNGSYWHARRKGVAPAFSNRHVKRMSQVALECTEKWIQQVLIPCAEEGKSFDLSEGMISITLEALCKTAFEYEVSEQEKVDFLNNSELVWKEFLNKSINNPFRSYLGRCLPDRCKALDAAHANVRFAKRIIAKHKANPNPIQGTIIQHLVSNPCYANEEELAADVLMHLTGGHDTTAYTMAFTLRELAKNPDLQKEVRDEIVAMDSIDQWRRSNALQMAIKESMRLYPASASGSSRVCGRDFSTKEGFTIPKGTNVVCHIMMMHRNEKIFGENADQFVPSRWENATQAQKDSFMIFSAGKQNCVGQSLAQAALHCIIPRILSEVELTVEVEGHITWFLTMKPIGIKLRAKRVVADNVDDVTGTEQRAIQTTTDNADIVVR